jgi:peptide chain release factor 2
MIILDDLRVELVAYRKDIKELSEVLKIEEAKEEIKSLQAEMELQGFWDDLESSQKVVQKSKTLQNKVEHFNQLSNKLEDTITMVELSIEEGDDSIIDEVMAEVNAFKTELEDIKLSTLLSGEYDNKNAIMTFHSGAGGTEAQDWAEMLYRMS